MPYAPTKFNTNLLQFSKINSYKAQTINLRESKNLSVTLIFNFLSVIVFYVNIQSEIGLSDFVSSEVF